MKLDLSPEQAFFAGTTREFLADKAPTSLLRELRSDPAGFGRDFWRAANAMADAAARHVQEESGRAGEYVSAGKSFLGSCALEVLQECVQFHGGIGVTFEHDLHLYLRRATVDSQLYGTVADHRERLTSILEDREQVNA
jgi:Acyl-CoA dehydrogenase, C-terminal domain